MYRLTNFFSKLQNAIRKNQDIVYFPYSQFSFEVAEFLRKEGYLKRVEVSTFQKQKFLWVVLKYQKNQPAFQRIHQYSTSGRSLFWRLKDFPSQGFYLLSTSEGILSKKDAFKRQIGGQVLCRIF
jgi:small subunit ribosomal protein S8